MKRRTALIVLSIPGLRTQDLSLLPSLQGLDDMEPLPIVPSFPCVTWPVQTAMLTGKKPAEHGVVANGLFDRDTHHVNMWTLTARAIEQPMVWDRLRSVDPTLQSAVWFPMLAKECTADYACMPAPVHNPDGSESLWCYSRPMDLYGELLRELGHFPLQHFWGPLANIASTRWILHSARLFLESRRPEFFYIYIPHLDYAAQKSGPDSEAARTALTDLDGCLAEFIAAARQQYASHELRWLVVSEYAISPVDSVSYPNRRLRAAGLLRVQRQGQEEYLDFAASDAWCLVDHQFSHVFVKDREATTMQRVKALFEAEAGIAEVWDAQRQREQGIWHKRSGDLVLISRAGSWQAYYWWDDDSLAPHFAHTVDIHRKPGYDPVELFWDPAKKGVPLDASLVRGSHGAPVSSETATSLALVPRSVATPDEPLRDTAICGLIERLLLGGDRAK